MSRLSDHTYTASAHARRRFLLFWGAVLLLLLAAVLMRLVALGAPFDHDSYDEGVYWQSLRAMQAGGILYRTIFYSQPPAFLLTAFPLYHLFGGTLEAARLAITLVSLCAFPGAYLLGRALAGRAGALAALLLLVINPFFLAESQIIQAEASSVAFTFLAVGCAFAWWRHPEGWRGACWAALAGAALVVSILCKLLCLSTLLPLLLLALARVWQVWRTGPQGNWRGWLPILTGVGGALLAALVLLLPFLGSSSDFWQSVVTFHQVAGAAVPGTLDGNLSTLEPALLSPLTLVALYGTCAALLRRDWRVIPLLAWLLVTVFLLATFHPLFPHHVIALEPPLIALAVSGVAGVSSYKSALLRLSQMGYRPETIAAWIGRFATLLLLCTSLSGLWQDVQYYRATSAIEVGDAVLSPWSGLQFLAVGGFSGPGNPWQGDLRVAQDLHSALTPEQWVVTDAQFIAGLADRDTPPALVDTSSIRIDTGYLTVAQLEQIAAAPRVHAVLFYTDRLYWKVPSFVAWVTRHFHILHIYGPGRELWVR
jgi:hypothetical protein